MTWRAYRLPALSAGLSLLLGAMAIVDLAAAPRHWALPALAPPPTAGPAAAPQILPPPREEFAESLERPLFSASRRPPPAAPAKNQADGRAQAQRAAAGSLALIGTIIGPQTRIALIRNGSAPTQRVTPGQSVEGWEIVEITKDRVVLRGGGSQQELTVPPPSQSNGNSHPAARSPSQQAPR